MPRFFIRADQVRCENGIKTITITGDDAHHISRSLRMATGEKITVCDMQKNVYECVLCDFSDEKVIARVDLEHKSDTEPVNFITLYQAIPKSDKMETIIQKSVECGVSCIVPFSSERCIAKIDKKDEDKKVIRYNKISESASKQSGRGIIPEVKKPISYDTMLKEACKSSYVLFCYEGDGTQSMKDVLKNVKKDDTISLIIGSEGGFSIKEVEKAKESGAYIVGLGKRILRCETAPSFALSCIAYETEL